MIQAIDLIHKHNSIACFTYRLHTVPNKRLEGTHLKNGLINITKPNAENGILSRGVTKSPTVFRSQKRRGQRKQSGDAFN